MEHEIVVKSEMNNMNGEFLVLYVDENGTEEQAVITTIQNLDGASLEELQQGNFIIQEVGEGQQQEQEEEEELEEPAQTEDQSSVRWTDEDTRRLLIFYIDNKETFLNNQASTKQLWTIACKQMLTGKNATMCERKLFNLKQNYTMIRLENAKGNTMFVWPYYDLCHQAFHDENFDNILPVNATPNVEIKSESPNKVTSEKSNQRIVRNYIADAANIDYSLPSPMSEKRIERNVKQYTAANVNHSGPFLMRVTSEKKSNEKKGDESVEQMLNWYLKLKRLHVDLRKKTIWEQIAQELGEDAEYWHRRFLNFKQHYITMVEKRRDSGPQSVNWPYMNIFDQIFEDDLEFQRKYGRTFNQPQKTTQVRNSIHIMSDTTIIPPKYVDWDDTEKTVLVKYYFDCFDEFQDRTIPNAFLWHEIGRLLDKKPDECKKKYEEMKSEHMQLYIAGNYDICNRIPIAILFDNIIAKEVELELNKHQGATELEGWTVEEIDALVQFFYDNLEMFKDSICHFVCWAAVSKNLNRTIQSCKNQWDDLTALYKTILEDKKEDPDLEVDWRYIELFERIFDYGMDTKLLEGYESKLSSNQKTENAPVKTVKLKMEEEYLETDEFDDDEEKVAKRTLGKGDEKSFKILEYYLKNKDKFATKRKGQWDALAKQIGISSEQCAHRFRNLKQVYTSYIQREINKPEAPILWPYYHLCKRVFGYRQIKNRLKNANSQSDDTDEWSPKDIKKVINHFARYFNEIDDTENSDRWKECAEEIGKSINSCREKFLELRKSYRKVKTVMTNNPDCKVNWKYFKLFEEIYSGKNVEAMDVDSDNDSMDTSRQIKTGVNEDDDYQCIIVLPEGEEMPSQEALSDIPNAQIIITDNSNTMPAPKPPGNKVIWKMSDKKRVLEKYLNYIRNNEGKIINTKDMWSEITNEMPNKSLKSCNTSYMYNKMKNTYKKRKDEKEYRKTKFYELFQQIAKVKTKFYKPPANIPENVLKESNLCENVDLLDWKVELALKYYLDNLEEFILPKYVTEHVWKEFVKMISIPLKKLIKKINYLKNFYNSETNEVDGKQVPYGHLIRQILEKELQIRINMATEPVPSNSDDDGEVTWTDDDIHNLLEWYLENLQRFKNPKYVKSYLWMEAAKKVGKSAVNCSKMMSEIRTQYSNMVKESPQVLPSWKFYDLCQKIYGTGKKPLKIEKEVSESVSNIVAEVNTNAVLETLTTEGGESVQPESGEIVTNEDEETVTTEDGETVTTEDGETVTTEGGKTFTTEGGKTFTTEGGEIVTTGDRETVATVDSNTDSVAIPEMVTTVITESLTAEDMDTTET